MGVAETIVAFLVRRGQDNTSLDIQSRLQRHRAFRQCLNFLIVTIYGGPHSVDHSALLKWPVPVANTNSDLRHCVPLVAYICPPFMLNGSAGWCATCATPSDISTNGNEMKRKKVKESWRNIKYRAEFPLFSAVGVYIRHKKRTICRSQSSNQLV